MNSYRSVLRCGALAAAFCLGGCYENIEPQTSETQAEQPAPASGARSTQRTGGHSSLGGAKRAAEGVASDLEQRSQEIADGIDNANQ